MSFFRHHKRQRTASERLAQIRSRQGTAAKPKPDYWYVWAHATGINGKRYLIGPKATREEAYQFGLMKLKVPFDVVSSKEGDLDKANRELKFQDLSRTGDLEYSVEPVGHEKMIDYENRRGL